MLAVGKFFQLHITGIMGQIAPDVLLRDICDINHRLHGEQRRVGKQLALLVGHFDGARAFSGFERRFKSFKQFDLRRERFVALHCLFRAVDAAVNHLKVGKNQFQIDGLHIAQRVNATVDMDDIIVLKAADNVYDCIDLADMREKFIAEPLALGGAAHQSGYVDKFNHGRRIFLGMVHFRENVQTLVRHRNDAHVRVDGAERIVGRLRARVGQSVEQRTLADVRQTDDSKFH